MTERSENNESISSEKLLIDDPSNFQFHAAYLAYSDAYDKATSPETRKRLNQDIVALQQNQIDCATFYANIDQFRVGSGSRRDYGRAIIKTQRKREWQRKTRKHERIMRHRK